MKAHSKSSLQSKSPRGLVQRRTTLIRFLPLAAVSCGMQRAGPLSPQRCLPRIPCPLPAKWRPRLLSDSLTALIDHRHRKLFNWVVVVLGHRTCHWGYSAIVCRPPRRNPSLVGGGGEQLGVVLRRFGRGGRGTAVGSIPPGRELSRMSRIWLLSFYPCIKRRPALKSVWTALLRGSVGR